VGKKELERPLPHDDLLERTVLGAILGGHKQNVEILDAIRVSDFAHSFHRKIASVLIAAKDAGKIPNLLTIYDTLESSGEIEQAGGIAYLSSISDGIPLAGDSALFAAKRIRSLSALGKIVHIADRIQTLALERVDNAEQILDQAIEELSGVARDIESDEDNGETYFDAAGKALCELRQGPRIKIFTGVDRLDQWTGGFREGELILLTAETGTGKSLLASQVRARACRDGFHTLFCSGEMLSPHLVKRHLAPEADVEPIKMRREDLLTPEDFEALVTAASHQCKKCRILDGELELSRIRRASRKMKNRDGLELLILDYDELIEAPGKDEFEQQRQIARKAKSIGMELGCVVILISQLRKSLSGEDVAKPSLQRLYGSGAKMKHASYIVLADRPYVREMQGDEKEARLFVLKSRDGRTGPIKATFNIRKLRFDGVEEQKEAAFPNWQDTEDRN
jgi:replicative DNA helicase